VNFYSDKKLVNKSILLICELLLRQEETSKQKYIIDL
jgi:hypothetical protein